MQGITEGWLRLNRAPSLPLRQQIRAAIIEAVASGALRAGTALPSVRNLARTMDVAPMTITKVLADLKSEGLVVSRAGSGTYVADSGLARQAARGAGAGWDKFVDDLVDRAEELGIEAADMVSLVALRVADRRRSPSRKRLVMAGLFVEATEHYARCVSDQLGGLAQVVPLAMGMNIDAGGVPDDVTVSLQQADLILTFASLSERIEALAAGVPVLSLRFIPSEATRMALAAIDPLARVAVVSRFADFLPVLTLGVRRFAAHVQSVTALDFDAPELAAAIAGCDVVVISTGAESSAALTTVHTRCIEYRHIPDPGDVERLVAPLVAPPAFSVADRKEAS